MSDEQEINSLKRRVGELERTVAELQQAFVQRGGDVRPQREEHEHRRRRVEDVRTASGDALDEHGERYGLSRGQSGDWHEDDDSYRRRLHAHLEGAEKAGAVGGHKSPQERGDERKQSRHGETVEGAPAGNSEAPEHRETQVGVSHQQDQHRDSGDESDRS